MPAILLLSLRSRRRPATLPSALVGLLLPAILASGAAAQDRPNVVLIIGDDYGWPDSGFMESPRTLSTNQGTLPIQQIVQTPNLDALAAFGVLFRNGHSTASVCLPALRTLLSAGGLHSDQWAALEVSLQAQTTLGSIPVRAESQYIRTVPRELRRLGYWSWEGGKMWEGTYEMAGFTHGLATSIGGPLLSVGDDFGRTGWSTATCGSTATPGASCPALAPLRSFLDGVGEDPFFLWFAPLLPHLPWNAPSVYRSHYESLGLTPSQVSYLATVTWLDQLVGELIEELTARGLRDDTLILFVVDNGWGLDFQTFPGAGKGKGTLYEMGFRTPIIFNWPGHIPGGAVYDDLVSTTDIVPTIFDYVGADPVPEQQGISLRPRIEGGPSDGRPAIIGQHSGWFLRTDEWRYLRFPDGHEELYRIDVDPFEDFDLAADEPALLASFGAQVDAWVANLHQPPPRIEISGRLVDWQTGAPMVGASLRVSGTMLNAITGPDGLFRLGPLPTDDYTLIRDGRLGIVDGLGSPGLIPLPESVTARGVHLPIAAQRRSDPPGVFAGSLKGHLTSDLGAPIANRIVELRGLAAGHAVHLRTETQPDGSYRAENLPYGVYRVTVASSAQHQRVRIRDVAVAGHTTLDLVAASR